MNFLVHLFNHTQIGRRSLEDVVGICGKQLRQLGHTIFWDPENDDSANMNFVVGPDSFNIIVEGFTPGIVEMVRRAKEETGARFICLATAKPVPNKGFNHGTTREMV